MRNAAGTVARLLIACHFVWLAACEPMAQSTEPPPPPAGGRLAVPDQGAYTGAYIDFGETEDNVTLEAIEDFEKAVGKHQAIVASSSYWGEQTFPGRNLEIISRYGAVPLVFWSPWDKPYDQDRGPDRYNLFAILAGDLDGYIDMWADGARAFGKPMFVAWGIEMNGTWFPWSGFFYGAGRRESEDRDFLGPEIYKKAYRYIVDRVRARGAGNILWVYHVNNYSYPNDTWNEVDAYYPGAAYVDWLAMSAYGMQYRNAPWVEPEDTLTYPYELLCELDPAKPVMIAEWGVGDFPKRGDKAKWIREALELLAAKYPRMKAAIFWHERWQNKDGSFSNLRVTSSNAALDAYRAGVANAFWIGWPEWIK